MDRTPGGLMTHTAISPHLNHCGNSVRSGKKSVNSLPAQGLGVFKDLSEQQPANPGQFSSLSPTLHYLHGPLANFPVTEFIDQ